MFRRRWSLGYLFLLPTIVMDNHSLPQIERAEANMLPKYTSNTHDLRIFNLMLSRQSYIGAWSNTRPSYIFSLTISQQKYIGNNIVDRFGYILKQLADIAILKSAWTMWKWLKFLRHFLTKCWGWRDFHCEIRLQ